MLPAFRLLMLFVVAGCALVQPSRQPDISRDARVSPIFLPPSNRAGFNDPLSYIPDTNHLDHTPVRYVRLNFHFVNSSDSSHNYNGDAAYAFVEGLLVSANEDLRRNNALWLPYRNRIPVIPTRVQLTLSPGNLREPGDRGIYFHYDDDLCYYIHKGRDNNLFDRRVIEKYGVRTDSILNIFIMPHHPDSMLSRTYPKGPVGVAVGHAIKMAGIMESRQPAWAFRGVLNHEIGHVFGLGHAWLPDGCVDTPEHGQPCWNRTDTPPCDTAASNNVMDYNALQNAWSPCQIGKIQQTMADVHAAARRFLVPNWCKLDPEQTITIRDTVQWTGARDLCGDLRIAPGGQLTIRCRVSLPEGGKILVQAGGTLILDNALLHNACTGRWEGIQTEDRGRSKGKVIWLGTSKLENTSDR